jgi:hypothetical protein
MKKLFLFVLTLIALHVSAQTAKKKYPYRVIRTLTADLNNDGKTDSINLISSLEGRNDFNRISISLNGIGKTVFNAKDYWTVVDSDFRVKNKNLINTKLLFAKKTDRHAVILLFGEMTGSGQRGEFSILNIENNEAKMVFDDTGKCNIDWVADLADLKHDGRLDFVYKNSGEFYAQGQLGKIAGNIGTYVPYFVYAVDDECKIDTLLTKEYNQAHYVYAGLDFSKEIEIFYPNNGGKPSIWKKPKQK